MKALSREQWVFCLQIGVATLLAYQVTHGSDPANAIYAILGAALVTTPNMGEGLGVSRERLIGTLLGALASLPAIWIREPALSLALTLAVVGPLGLRLGGVAVARIAVTMAAVTVVLHGDTADIYGFLRFTNTMAGVGVALAVSFLLWPLSSRQHFSSTLRSALSAAAGLAEQLSRGEARDFPLSGQRDLFAALSAIPKAIGHMRLDPLLYRQRASLQLEAQLAVKICIALLAVSLALGRERTALPPGDLAEVQACCGHIGQRLRNVYRKNFEPCPAGISGDGLLHPGVFDGHALRLAQIGEELQSANLWLDALQVLLRSRSEKQA